MAGLRELESVYRERLPELQRVAAAIAGSREAAPDLVQEAFARAVRQSSSYRGDGAVDGWVWRIVVNVARNHRRDTQGDAELLDGRRASAELEDLSGVAEAVRALPERQRLVLFLRYYAELDYRTIAEALEISSGAVGSTLTAARTALQHALRPEEATS